MEILDSVLEMLAYELAAILAVFSLWLFIRNHKKNRQINETAARLVNKLKRNKEKRMGTLSELLAEKYGLQAEALQQLASEFQEREQQLYKSLLKLYVEQNGKLLLNFPQQLESLLDESLKLHPVGGEDNHTIVIDDSLPLNEQIEQTARKLEMLMAQFRRLNGDQANEKESQQQSNETTTTEHDEIGEVSEEDKAGINSVSVEENDVDVSSHSEIASETDEGEIEIEVLSEESETQETEQGNNEEQKVEIEVAEVEANVSEEDEIVSDEIDEVLETTNAELSDNEVDGIDLSAVDEDKEGEASVKKSENDSGNTIQSEDDKIPEAVIEKVENEIQKGMDIDQSVDTTQSPADVLPSSIEQSDVLKSTDTELEPEISNSEMAIHSGMTSEEEAESDNDIHTVTDGQPDMNINIEAKHEVDLSEEDEKTIKHIPKINIDANINKQSETETQQIRNTGEGERLTESSSNTKDTNFDIEESKKGMQAYLKQDWDHSIPDIYGKNENKDEKEQGYQEQALQNNEVDITTATDNKQAIDNEIIETDIVIDEVESEALNTRQSEVDIESEVPDKYQSEVVTDFDTEDSIDSGSVIKPDSQTEDDTQLMEEEAESEFFKGETLSDELQNKKFPIYTPDSHSDTKINDDADITTSPVVSIIGPRDKLEPESKSSPEIELNLSSSPHNFSSEEEYLTAKMQIMSGAHNKEEAMITDSNHAIATPSSKERDEPRFVEPTEALSDMVMDFTQEYYEPLPSESEFESMLSEIRDLEQDPTLMEKESKQDDPVQDELQTILSSIPSFSEINKK